MFLKKYYVFYFLRLENRKQFLVVKCVFQFFCSKKQKIVLKNSSQMGLSVFGEYLLVVFTYFLRPIFKK